MFKDITDVMLARAYAVDFMFQTLPPAEPRPSRHLVRRALAWGLRKSGRALTWSGERIDWHPATPA